MQLFAHPPTAHRYGLLPDMMEGEAEAEAGLPGPQPLDESPIIQGPPSDVEGIADTGIKKVTKQRQSLRNMSQQVGSCSVHEC